MFRWDGEGEPSEGMMVESAAQAREMIDATPRMQLAERRISAGMPEADDVRWLPEPGKFLSLPPCVPAGDLAEIRRDTDGQRFCPRVELDVANSEASALTFLSLRKDPLLVPYYDAVMVDASAGERATVLRRCLMARSHPAVIEALRPEPKKGRR